MGGFESKRALLEHLGKNPDDRKLIKRMIERGEAYEKDGMYYIVGEERGEEVGKKSEPRVEEEGVRMDDKELKELKEKDEKLISVYKDLREKYESLKKRCEKEKDKADAQWGLYDHLVFFYGKYLEWKKFVEGKVFGQTEHNKSLGTQDTMETVRPEVYERYKFSHGEIEQAECDAVEKIIAKRAEEIAEIPF